MKDLCDLEEELTRIIETFEYFNVSSDASFDAPIKKNDLEHFRNETANTLYKFKNAIIQYLSK